MNTFGRALLLGAVAGLSCWAIPIANPSFESPVQAANGFTFDAATSWNVTGAAGVWFPNVGLNTGSNYFTAVPDGNQILFEGYQSTGDANQDLGVALTANTTYTLSYFVGQRYDLPLSSYLVAVKAGAVVLASDDNSSGTLPTAGNFVQRTFNFSTGDSPLAGDIIIDISASGFTTDGVQPVGGQAAFDLITLTAAPVGQTPEPGALSLMGLGIAAIAFAKRRFISKA